MGTVWKDSWGQGHQDGVGGDSGHTAPSLTSLRGLGNRDGLLGSTLGSDCSAVHSLAVDSPEGTWKAHSRAPGAVGLAACSQLFTAQCVGFGRQAEGGISIVATGKPRT